MTHEPLRYCPAGCFPYIRAIRTCHRALAWWALAFLLVSFSVGPSGATASTSQICDNAAYRASQESGVPLEVLRAITRTETGRGTNGRLEPWPWTVNMEGKGRWFDTEDEARAYVFQHFKRGARSFDIGCFQINYRWHGQAFSSIDQMFDPLMNARYAAQFIKSLHAETGNWSKAAGKYHSRTPRYSARYRARFDKIRSSLSDQPLPQDQAIRPVSDANTPRAEKTSNRYPLLQGGQTHRSPGSLVPLDTNRAVALIGPSGQALR